MNSRLGIPFFRVSSWWTTARDRTGDWTGQKHQPEAPVDQEPDPAPQPDYPDETTI